MENIDAHIAKDKSILDNPLISAQSRRHTESELELLELYKERHPEVTKTPNSLELYCDMNPSAPECRMYND